MPFFAICVCSWTINMDSFNTECVIKLCDYAFIIIFIPDKINLI